MEEDPPLVGPRSYGARVGVPLRHRAPAQSELRVLWECPDTHPVTKSGPCTAAPRSRHLHVTWALLFLHIETASLDLWAPGRHQLDRMAGVLSYGEGLEGEPGQRRAGPGSSSSELRPRMQDVMSCGQEEGPGQVR